jgi:hypothetical protein
MSYNKKNKLENYRNIAEWQKRMIDIYFPDRNANMAYLFNLYQKDKTMSYIISYKTFINIYNYPINIELKNINKEFENKKILEPSLFPELD